MVGLTVARAALIGVAAAAAATIAAVLLDASIALPPGVRRSTGLAILLAGTAAVLVTLIRARAVARLSRVALWVEERDPAPEWALVTLLESGSTTLAPELERRSSAVRWGRLAAHAATRALAAPAFIALIALALIAWLPRTALDRIERPAAGDALDRPTLGRSDAADPLRPLRVTVREPEYLGGATRAIDDPVTVRATVGGSIDIVGRQGRQSEVDAAAGSTRLPVTTSGSRWSATYRVTDRPVVIHLRAGERERLLAIEPVPDRSPAVSLTLPARDSVMRVAAGRLPLAASVTDDHGIVGASFEAIVSSGAGETFSFRTLTLGTTDGAGRASLSLAAPLPLDSLALQPGDVIHVRAIARDANPAADGPGSSETRTIRVARAGEYDSIAVEGAMPPDPEKGVISQRMLIMLAEALEKRRPSLRRDPFVDESRAIARDQRKLRQQVGEIIFARVGDHEGHSHDEEEVEQEIKSAEDILRAAEAATTPSTEPLDFSHDESPVVAINRPLLEAYNAMWDATRELSVGEPGRALPHMRAALAAIQRARAAERIYLRGRPPAVVLDLARVRLSGKERGDPDGRRPRAARTDESARRERAVRAIALAAAAPAAALDSMLLLRIESLTDDRPLADALGAAIEALRTERDATDALVRLRRVAAGQRSLTRAPSWSGW